MPRPAAVDDCPSRLRRGGYRTRAEAERVLKRLRDPMLVRQGGLLTTGQWLQRWYVIVEPIIEEIRDLVNWRMTVVGNDPMARLFTGPRGGRITTAILRDATHWDEVVVSLGYEYLRRHDLRHTGLTWLADAGVPIHVLQKIAGHGHITTTQRYLHPDKSSIEKAGQTLSRHLSTDRHTPSAAAEAPVRHLRLVH